jgi:hypothetical protein
VKLKRSVLSLQVCFGDKGLWLYHVPRGTDHISYQKRVLVSSHDP